MRQILKRACHRAARILTVSDFTRTQIVELVWSIAPEGFGTLDCGVDMYLPSRGKIPTGLPFS